MAKLLFVLGFLLAVLPTALHFYLLVPVPGSQELDSFGMAYAVHQWLRPLQILGGALFATGLVLILRKSPGRWTYVFLGLTVLLGGAVFYIHYTSSAPVLFRPAEALRFEGGPTEEIPAETLVLGVSRAGHSKAYPIRLLAYHHQVEDELGGEPILAMYCTMCRTGKAFSPFVGDRRLRFDLIGAIRYNSIYEDQETGTWWAQANGRAMVGELEGERLTEIRADQMTLAQWLELHPGSEVLQPDVATGERYTTFNMHKFDEGKERPELGLAWQWVVGVRHGDAAKAYPWSILTRDALIQDDFLDLPLALQLKDDGASFRVWNRRLGDRVLDLELDRETDRLVDRATGTSFDFAGLGHGGELEGQRLESLPSVLEFWHSFEGFSGGVLYEPPEGQEPTSEDHDKEPLPEPAGEPGEGVTEAD